MDFKFKDEDKKTEDEAVKNEVAEIEAPDYGFTEQDSAENKVEEGDVFERDVDQSEAAGGATLEPYTGESEEVEDDVMESDGAGVQVGGGGTVQNDPAATRPKYRIPTEEEDAARNTFKFPLKQILLVIVLLGGGYYVKTYHTKEDKPKRIETPQVAEVPKPAPKVSSIEELSGLLDESKELLKSREERENRLRNQASERRSSDNTSSRQINFQALKNYKGQWVTIVMKDGMRREGRIADVKEQIVHLEQDYEYGTIAVRVPFQDIANIRE